MEKWLPNADSFVWNPRSTIVLVHKYLDFARFCIFVAIASLVEEALSSPSFFRRRQIEKIQEIARPGHLLRHLRRSSSGWAIACPNLLSRDLDAWIFRSVWGFRPGQEIAGEYARQLPSFSLRTEDVIGSLAGSTRPSSKEGPRCFRATFLPRRFPAPIPSRRRSAAARRPEHIRHLPSRPIRTR